MPEILSTGKAAWGKLALPFVATAVPEIEGGARLRFNFQQIHLVGPFRIPGLGVTWIGERINAELAHAFDATRLPIPLRLTGLTVEPGRFLLTATAKLEFRALEPGTELQPTDAPR